MNLGKFVKGYIPLFEFERLEVRMIAFGKDF